LATALKFALRPAVERDVAALNALIDRSARALSVGYYTPAQAESAIRYVFGVDRQLIADGTYYLAEVEQRIVGCGGWSKRKTLFGGDQYAAREDALLDPRVDAARIRAFFVDPDFARRGIGRAILDECERAARAAGFTRAEMAATLPGEPLYAACGYRVEDSFDIAMPGGFGLPVRRMVKSLRRRKVITAMPTAGYYGTPLAKKLGIKPGQRVVALGAPKDYGRLVAPLPDGATIVTVSKPPIEMAHVFVVTARELNDHLRRLRKTIIDDGVVWVSWSKRASNVETDVTEDVVRAIALPMGFVDVKVCAVDETWSGLKLVIRKGLRAG
jgi:GNAT superfamily N-acetyltransferase